MDLDGSGEPERLFRFVRELVYRFDVEAFVPAQVESAGLGDGRVRVLGETFDPARHTPEHQVKALTRHGYRFDRRDGVLEAELVFDL
jgi:SHS2 domain-containing protein